MNLFDKYCLSPCCWPGTGPGFAGNSKYESDTSSALEELTVQEGEGPAHKHGKAPPVLQHEWRILLCMGSEEEKVSSNQIPPPQTPWDHPTHLGS